MSDWRAECFIKKQKFERHVFIASFRYPRHLFRPDVRSKSHRYDSKRHQYSNPSVRLRCSILRYTESERLRHPFSFLIVRLRLFRDLIGDFDHNILSSTLVLICDVFFTWKILCVSLSRREMKKCCVSQFSRGKKIKSNRRFSILELLLS